MDHDAEQPEQSPPDESPDESKDRAGGPAGSLDETPGGSSAGSPGGLHAQQLPALTALPYLTADLPGIGGTIKERDEDFIVTEVPAYEPCGEGTHSYFAIEKVGIDTRAAVVRISKALGLPAREFGYAGLKDRHAVTRQVISVEHVDPALIEKLDVQGVKVLWVKLHGNKIRLGHLRGNRFDIRIRGVARDKLAQARAILDVLKNRGMPNFYGPQRFGVRATGHQLGLALLAGDDKEFIDQFLGRPQPGLDYGAMLRARQLYEGGHFDKARQAWPGHHRDERSALAALAHGRNARRAKYAIDRQLRRFLVSRVPELPVQPGADRPHAPRSTRCCSATWLTSTGTGRCSTSRTRQPSSRGRTAWRYRPPARSTDLR